MKTSRFSGSALVGAPTFAGSRDHDGLHDRRHPDDGEESEFLHQGYFIRIIDWMFIRRTNTREKGSNVPF